MTIRCSYADLPWGQVHYRSAGDTGPVVLLLHQTPLSSRMFERALPHLAAHCRAIAIDTPGYGASSPLPDSPAIEAYAEAILNVAASIGADRLTIAGFATGAAIAVEAARQAGTNVTHLVLSGAPMISKERFAELAAALGEPDVRHDGQHLIDIWKARQNNYGRDNDVDQLQMAVAETFRTYDRLHWGLRAAARYDLPSALGEIHMPTLFLTAENDILATENRAAVALVDGAKEAVLEGGMPQLCWTQPKWFSDQVRGFIATR